VKTLLDIVRRSRDEATPEKIPWDDPEFSERMLREHLSQSHDLASRRSETIDAQVGWIDGLVDREPRMLDLGCGPGLYTQRLTKLGHRCTGIDFSQASIRYAIEQAETEGLDIEYRQDDVRSAEYGGPYDLVMMLFGEFNVFSKEDSRTIARKAREALAPGGHLLLEHQTLDCVRKEGEQGPRWYSMESGLFSDQPHIVLEEHRWDEGARTHRALYFVIDAGMSGVERYGETIRGYEDDVLAALLTESGFVDVRVDESFPSHEAGGALQMTVAHVPV
jgi:SAM-dependent methyltransferase